MAEAVPRYSVGVLDDGNRETVQLQVSLPGEGLVAGTVLRHMLQRMLPPPACSCNLQPATCNLRHPPSLCQLLTLQAALLLAAACRGGGQQRNPVHH